MYHSSNSRELHSCVVIMVPNPDGLFLHTKSLLSASNLEAVAVKFTGLKVWREKLSPWWQMSDCYKTRSSSFPSRGGLICAFCSYFLKQSNNKSSLRKVLWLGQPLLLWLLGIKMVSILDRDSIMRENRAAARRLHIWNCSLDGLKLHYLKSHIQILVTFHALCQHFPGKVVFLGKWQTHLHWFSIDNKIPRRWIFMVDIIDYGD